MKRYINLVLLLITVIMGVQAQEVNKVYLKDVEAIKGKTITLPIYLNNTSSNIVAVQFDLTLPDYASINTSTAQLIEERTDDHDVSVMGISSGYNTYRFMVYSPNNKPIKGHDGSIINIEIPLSESMQEGVAYKMELSKVILSDSRGNNVMTGFNGANLTIKPTPDFEITEPKISQQSVIPGDTIEVDWKVSNVGNIASTGGWSERVYFISRTGEQICIDTLYNDIKSLAVNDIVNRHFDIVLPKLLGIDGKVNLKIELIPNDDSGESSGYLKNNITSTENYTITVYKQLYLTLPTIAIKEGEQDYIECAIARSGNWKSDQKVTLTKTGDDRLILPENVIIPNGLSSKNFFITIKDNEKLDEDSVFTISAAVQNYSTVSGNIIIRDDDLAKLILTAPKTVLNEGEKMTMTVTCSSAPDSQLSVSVKSNMSSYLKYPQTIVIEAGSKSASFDIEFIQDTETTDDIRATMTIEAPNYENGKFQLLLIDDDKLPTVNLNKGVYKPRETALISGQIFGADAAVSKLEIYVIHNGFRQIIETRTDSEGLFNVTYNISENQNGHFIVGVCKPGEDLYKEMASFDVYGLQLNEYSSEREIELGNTFTGTISISNTAQLKQTGLKIEETKVSENCTFKFSVPEEIEAGGNVQLAYTITPNAVSEGLEWQQMPIEISTNEGGKTKYIFYYYVLSPTALLQSNPRRIETTMTKGQTREYPIVIRNTGKGETGIITLDLPKFIKTTTTQGIPSIAQGDSTTIILEFTPTEDMVLNIPVEGVIGINCENANGLAINYQIEPVSENNGHLNVDVTDELTYYAETVKAPHVKGAKISIKHPVTEEVILNGTSDDEGLFSTDLPEGRYILEVTAEKHEAYKNQLMIDPGKDKNVEAFLAYQNVTYDWNVIETEVEDLYNLELVADYDVRIPKPALIVELDIDERPVDGTIIPIKVTNKGLININDVNIDLTVTPSEYVIEFQNNSHMDYLAPQQTEVFYAKVKRNSFAGARRLDSGMSHGIDGIYGSARGTIECGPDGKEIWGSDIKYWEVYLNSLYNIGGIIGPFISNHDNSRSKDSNKVISKLIQNVTTFLSTNICYDPADPNDPNNPNAPNDPINRKKVPDENDPQNNPPIPCDSDQEPVLVYKLIPISGERYEMNGVAADGVSQVKIVLDPQLSHVPNDDCGKIANVSWKLSRELGTIEGSSIKEAIYTAPKAFPAKFGASATVEATVTYLYYTKSLVIEKHASVTIVIIRPPVVFIHGLGSSQDCWKKLDDMLVDPMHKGGNINSALYKPDINYRVDYKISNTMAFQFNTPVVGTGILKAQRRALCQGYVATKCDLIGHSMGGILARLFVERGGNKDNVNRIITVNTPHSGSQLGDIVMAHNKRLGPIAKLFYGKDDLSAIENLGVESEETSLLVTVPGKFDIPVFALATENDLRDVLLFGGSLIISKINEKLLAYQAASEIAAVVDPEPISKGLVVLFALATTFATNEAGDWQHLIEDDYAQIGDGDLVVSSVSQTGGCNASEIIKHGPWHVSSTNNKTVMEKIEQLLVSSQDDGTFATDWFRPKKLEFKHNDLFNFIEKEAGFLPIFGSSYSLGKGYAFRNSIIKRHILKTRGQSENADDPDSNERIINIDLNTPEGLNNLFISVSLNGHVVCFLEENQSEYVIPNIFAGEVKLIAFMKGDDGHTYYDEKTLNVEEPLANPVSLTLEETTLNVDESEPLRLYCTWNDGSVTKVVPDNVTFGHDNVAALVGKNIVGLKQGLTNATANYRGLTCNGLIRVFASEDNDSDEDEPSEAVCSKVTLSFKQEMVMTRQAFRGTLTVNNGSGTKQLRDLKLNLEVKDEDGNIASEHEFQINPESLEGFNGELNFTSGWSLDAESRGTANILYIPTKFAAPTEAKKWWFGGTFSYTDPDTGLTVTRELYAVPMTVKPSPQLALDYFLQRDVFGDDALTEDIVEPSVPAEFSLLINNIGYGDAQNVKMATNMPAIIDNEKGLKIDFNIVSSQLNGEDKVLVLGQTIPTDFGTIEAGKKTYAQWLFESTLMGHFIKYDAKSTHITSYGNPDLSLLDTVRVHELIHTLNMDDQTPGWLVNDLPDSKDLPDKLYMTNGNVMDVTQATATITSEGDNLYTLKAIPTKNGWNYGNIIDPTEGSSLLIAVTRMSDGASIDLKNFWQTDRTLRDGKDPLYEHRIHFADDMSVSGESYLLEFESKKYMSKLEYDLPAGWNWISSNLIDEDKTNSKQFLDPIKQQVIRLVGYEDELTNDYVYGLVGGLTTIKPEEGYKLSVKDPVRFSYSGEAGDPTQNMLTLQEGWNWIGYLPITPLSVDEALAELDPSENDVLKSYDAFATFAGGKWTGSLTEMNPGEGYMYYSKSIKSFNYPKAYPTGESQARLKANKESNATPWKYDAHKFADNTTLIGQFLMDNVPDESGTYIIGAFYNDECRGVGKNINGQVFITIHGSISDAQSISFRAYDPSSGKEYKIGESIVFRGQTIGTPNMPMALNSKGTTRISAVNAGFVINPRPLKNRLFINGDVADIKTIRVLATNGKSIIDTHGYDTVGIDVSHLLPGLYIISIKTNNGNVYYDKVFKDK